MYVSFHELRQADLISQVVLENGETYRTDRMALDSEQTSEETPGVHVVRKTYLDCGNRIELQQIIRRHESDGSTTLKLKVVNLSKAEQRVGRWEPVLLPVELPVGSIVYMNGRTMIRHQMVYKTGSDMRYTLEDGYYLEGMFLTAEDRRTLVSSMFTVVGAEETGYLLLGYITSHRSINNLEVELNSNEGIEQIRAVSIAEGFRLQPWETWESEEVVLTIGRDLKGLIESYADVVGQASKARVDTNTKVPSVWCSWYYYYNAATEQDIRENALALRHAGIPLDYIQIDDGYQTAYGDWLCVNDKFSGGMKALAQSIREQGFIPGIWLAPFILSKDSQVYNEHPDWVVRDANGDPCNVNDQFDWFPESYLLDFTHPEARGWFRQVLRTVVDDWGYRYLKLDFLTMPVSFERAVYYRGNMTGIAHLRAGLELIRDTVGEEVFILACTCDFGPAIGLVDGMRVGLDISLKPVDIRNSGQISLMRGFMHKRWFLNDPDGLLVRTQEADHIRMYETRRTEGMLRYHVAATLLSGGMLVSSDNISQLEPAKLELLRRSFEIPRTAAAPLDLGRHPFPELYMLRASEKTTYLGIFNHSGEEKSITVDLQQMGPSAACCFFTGAPVSLTHERTVRLEPLTAELIRIEY